MKNEIKELSMEFAIRIVKLYQYLCKEKQEFILSKQVLKSGTSVGANVAESQQGQSRADFGTKLNIALKEISETKYWLELLFKTNYIIQDEYESLIRDATSIEKLLVSILKKVFIKN